MGENGYGASIYARGEFGAIARDQIRKLQSFLLTLRNLRSRVVDGFEVHVISKSAWRNAIEADPALEAPISAWHKLAREAKWTSLVDIRKTYPHADFADPYTVFNIKGNNYRLIVKIEYKWQMIFVKHLLTHEDYDQGDWE